MNEADSYVPRVPRRQRRLAIRGCEITVHEWGQAGAPLIVYLHGWGDCGATFQFVVDEFARPWHVVAPDLRGFGDSRPANSTAYWFPDYLADLDRLLDDVSAVRPVCLVGHSMGGNIAGLYAGSLPTRVSALVNLEGFGLPDTDPAEAPRRYREWLGAARTLTGFATYADFAALARHLARRHPGLGETRARFVARHWARAAGGEVRLKADPLHKLPNPVLYRRAEAEACWRNVACPTLLLAGSDSEVLRRIVDACGSLEVAVPIPGAVVETLPGAAHMLHFTDPGPVAARIEAFLAPDL